MTFYGQHGLDRILLERYFAADSTGTIIECGALDGLTLSHSKVFEDLGWRSINIEPVPILYERLCQNRPRAININAALSDRCGSALFRQAIHPEHGSFHGNGSLKHSAEHLRILEGQGCVFEEIAVQTLTYGEIVRNIDSVDLMILDIEGHEMSALAGMIEPLPRVLAVEVYFCGLDNVRGSLERFGYNYEFTNVDDAVFVRSPKIDG